MAGSLQSNSDLALMRLQPLVQDSAWQCTHWNNLLQLGLPTGTDEDWKYTSLAKFNDVDFTSVKSTTVLSKSDVMLWKDDGYRLIFIDGKFASDLSDVIAGVEIQRFEQWLNSDESTNDAIRPEFTSELTDATAKDGLFITIAAKVTVDKPIYLLHFSNSKVGEVTSVRHHLRLEKLASCQLVEHHISSSDTQGVTLSRLSTTIADGARLEHIKLIEAGHEQYHLAHNDIKTGRDVNVSSSTFLLSGQLIRHQLSTELGDVGCDVSFNSLALPTSSECFDSRTFLHHSAPHCHSQQLHKIVGLGEGVGVFDGMIYVNQGAIKTDGQMDNHNLLLSTKSQVNSRPKLEIYADDVKCSHGATTGKIDPEQVFYLQARGIPKPLAEQMITKAFAAQVCEKVTLNNIRQYLLQHVTQKLECGNNV
ncbi:Fe-S cluster assembly protein SufD [Photobacterium kishitanii]|uniref:Fe-S cluster assembly protein SufD n=1 Tax=Photobacterium kishitanii TaxID=318456 RepID=UPI000D17C29B|nr:Fe-S cluster assembly protein SufD [Photobacterium kishitanii]PSU88266.1 Fe-S cluster assembly protein SufD [Photobacterium kishitanii]